MHHRHLLAAGLLSLAALSSAQATNVTVLAGSGWKDFFVADPAFNLGNTDFSWVDPNDFSKNVYSFTVAAGFYGTLTVVDAGFSGDVFSVVSNGSPLANTSAAVNSYPSAEGDYDLALANSNFSHGVYGFGPGTYTVTGALFSSALDDTGAALNATVGALKFDVAAVPEASTVAMLMAGLGVVGLLARRRAV
jgi:hypothetical protein